MKGCVTYDQLNASVAILHLPVKTLNNATHKLHQRFKEDDTKGLFFIEEVDIKEFTWMTVDKRFQGILNMLRHGQRLREQRGGFTCYVLQ
uniref:SKA complex subunit 1 n=1 Tax=Oncorhynchus tshawytscha TaxID=74940 RepID=A0AAZ3RD54_ONCTS